MPAARERRCAFSPSPKIPSPLPPRGERSSETRVRGPLRESELLRPSPAERPPHPTLSPHAGRGEEKLRRFGLLLRCAERTRRLDLGNLLVRVAQQYA